MIALLLLYALLGYVVASAASIVVLLGLFIVVMKLKVLHDAGQLNRMQLAGAYAIFYFGWTWDFLVNKLVLTVLFWELFPMDWTVSQRLQRLVDGKAGRRRNMAIWFAVKLINPFSPTPHIHLGAT
jgi:hypothetical protein